jgi:predicted RNA methylase
VNTSLFATNANHRLFTYAVLIGIADPLTKQITWYIKYGDTRKDTLEQAIEYATNETLGKLRGIIEKVNVLGAWDMTDHAIKLDPLYNPTLDEVNIRKGYDNAVRKEMPHKRIRKINFNDQQSLELHIVPEEDTVSPIWVDYVKFLWDDAHKTILNGGKPVSKKVYNARQYLVESFKKTSFDINKFLIAAATGSGKETSTLALIIHLHDVKKYANDIINVAVATIPSTISELFNELATVSGMNVDGYGFIDFSRIVPYVTKQWHDSYKKDCSAAALHFLSSHVKIVSCVDEIPKLQVNGQVPILFGSYHDLAQKANTISTRYSGLENRIGTLSIGEAHQMLGKADNKMWKQLDEMFGKKCFKLFITGTPYSFIYGNAAAEFFDIDHRALFTRNDVYYDKRTSPVSDFAEYPDFYFYGINVANVVKQLKTDPNWKDDAEGFTWTKLFTYDPNTKTFKYKNTILWLFKRMFGPPTAFNDNGDPLSIFNAKGLCEQAKQHIMVALPVGNSTASAQIYISALKDLLIKNQIFIGDIFDAYSDDLGDRKEDIANARGRTLTLTCNKDCTGANIPQLGSFVFLRNLGDSVNFFEQATGRIGRKFINKTNCGVFIGDLEASMNIMVTIEEKISLERNEDFSHKETIERILSNYNFFAERNGEWVQLEIPDLQHTIETLSAHGNYGINQCNHITQAEVGFNLLFNNTVSTESKKLIIVENGNDEAKNRKNEVFEQFGLPFDKKLNENQNWNNMKLLFIAKCRYLAFIYNTQTVAQCVALVEEAIATNNKAILNIIGKGVNYFPLVMQEGQIDIRFTNRWIQKFNNFADNIDFVLEEFTDEIYKTKDQFVGESNKLLKDIANDILDKVPNNKKIKIFDPCGGRGGLLVNILLAAQERNRNTDPTMLYYNDIDPTAVSFFKAINKKFNLGIPDENITCEDFLTKEYDMKFDVIVGNPPFNTASEDSGVSGTIGNNTLYRSFIQKSFELADTVVMISLKGALRFFENFDKQIDTVNMMTEIDYWKYDTLYFIGRNIPKQTPYTIVDKITNKMYGNNEFNLKGQAASLMQNRRNGTVVDGNTVIVKLNGEKPMEYGDVTKPEKVVYGPKFAFTMLESALSYTVTDEPMYASCVNYLSTNTLDEANRMMLFVKNNRAFRYFNKKMKTKGHANGISRLKKFDLSQIVTGFEYPVEWNLTADEITQIEKS